MIRCVKDLSPEPGRGLPPGRSYRFLGRPFEVRSNSPSLSGLLKEIYGAFRSPDPLPDPVVTCLYEEPSDRETPYRTVNPGSSSFLCSEPEQAVSFWGAQLMSGHLFRLPYLFVHASALEKDGRVLVFAGPSGGGKTTFILTLSEAGFTFFSDEFAPLAIGDGRVEPFPRAFLLDEKSLALVPGSGKLPFFRDYQEKPPGEVEPPRRYILSPGKVFSRIGDRSAAPAAFFFLDGFSGRATSGRVLPAGPALERLVAMTVNVRALGPEEASGAVETLAGLLSRVPAVLLRPGPPDEDPGFRVRAIKELAASPPAGAGDLGPIALRCREILEAKRDE